MKKGGTKRKGATAKTKATTRKTLKAGAKVKTAGPTITAANFKTLQKHVNAISKLVS